jgi:hypothetical protein
MFRNIFNGLCCNRPGRAFLAGAIGVLAGVEHLMSTRTGAASTTGEPRVVKTKQGAGLSRPRTDYFQIRRTKSELGYTFWVLQGFGRCSCFLLFDTWQEAIDEANLRLKPVPAREEQFAAAAAGGRL